MLIVGVVNGFCFIWLGPPDSHITQGKQDLVQTVISLPFSPTFVANYREPSKYLVLVASYTSTQEEKEVPAVTN